MARAARSICRAASELAIGSISEEFSGQMTNCGCGARPAFVLGQLQGLPDVIVQNGATLTVEVQSQPRDVALHSRDGDGRLVATVRCRADRTAGPASAVSSTTTLRHAAGENHVAAGGTRVQERAAADHLGRQRTARWRPASPAKDTNGAPAQCANIRNGPLDRRKAVTPQGNPPNGTLDWSHSCIDHRHASHSGHPGSRATTTAKMPNTAGNRAAEAPAPPRARRPPAR